MKPPINILSSPIITPPACIGIMGGGQLARMLAITAKQMGYQIAILEPDEKCPASHFADYHIKTPYNDIDGLTKLAMLSKVITTEFENVPADSIEFLSKHTLVYPNADVIKICQNRLKEKDFFNKLGYKTAEYLAIRSDTDINKVTKTIFPAILKTNTFGYDGKGQISVNNKIELIDAFQKLNKVACILEKKVTIAIEVSVIIAKSPKGELTLCSMVENIHHNGILESSISPPRITAQNSLLLKNMSLNMANVIDCNGLLTIEFFIDSNDNIIANEMAPRPHNSGHITINSCITSQFEQQIRAICNLSLGMSNDNSNAVMLNLLGDLWINNNIEHKFSKLLCEFPDIKLHLYEKQEAKIGRKMGHITILGNDSLNTYAKIKKILE